MPLLLLLLTLGTVTAGSASADSTSCSLSLHEDLDGGDILPANPPPTDTAVGCCEKCKGNSQCVAFGWSEHSGTCYLKNAAHKHPRPNHDRLSGYVNATCGCTASGPNTPKCWNTTYPCNDNPPGPPPSPPGPRPPPPPPTPPSQKSLGAYRCLNDTTGSTFSYCDQRNSIADRVESIVSNLTATELVAIILKQSVGRLDIGGYDMWANEALHGVRLWPEVCPFPDKCTTIFPTAATSSRAYNQTLWRQIGKAMGTEGRVLFNLGISSTLSYRGPQVNIQRDPRWGRNSNSPSEDPILTGLYGKQLVMGTQSPVNGVNLISSQMKHFTAYGVESNRMGFNGNVSVHDMADTYLVPLQTMLEANVSAAMCAYDAINGTPSCADGWMSKTILREQWGWQGVIESDCGALSNIQKRHGYTSDGLHTAAVAITNGTCDVECDNVYSANLLKSYTAGLVTIDVLQLSARRILTHRFNLGLFDDPRGSVYYNEPFNNASNVHSALHAQIAREAAQQSVVLVQNNGGVLPLTMKTQKFAVIGPLGNITDPFVGDYRPAACPGTKAKAPEGTACKPTLLELISKRTPSAHVAFASGCTDPVCSAAPDMTAVNAAIADADVIILTIGEKVTDNDSSGNTGGEGRDRLRIGLPGFQSELVTAALATKKPIVAVIISGGSVSIDALKNTSNVAVVYAGFGGETGADAVVDVLFADVPASGRLAFTVYPESWGNFTAMNDMSFQAGQGRSYKYLTPSVTPLYEFGSGLSYSTFALSSPSSPSSTATDSDVIEITSDPSQVCVSSQNTGHLDSPVVVIVFAVPKILANPPALIPNKKMIAFDKEIIAASSTKEICFNISDADITFVDSAGSYISYIGSYALEFFDGVSTVNVAMTISQRRVISTIPPVNNPQPPCCMGKDRSCC